ncbi:MAG TPA: LLM class flavin-dependent oxidoreductase [Dehalococcoidia bacterium]|nr:LLM class flavin-dependent oxidoreductase [Dehalococcoidia bacterium]
MRYALNLPTGGPCGDPATLADFAELAERSGWDAVFVEDYIVYQGREDLPTHDPWIALAAMATRTSRIRLGTMVTPLARRRPWKVAREATSLDHLSNGRVTLSVGLGDASTDSSFWKFKEELDDRRRAAMLDEALDIVAGLWTGEPFSYDGAHFKVDRVTFRPRPIQTPRIPIWVGGAYPNEGPMRRAARWDGANFYRAKTPGSAGDSGRGLTLDEFIRLREYILSRRKTDAPLDLVVHPQRHPRSAESEVSRLRAFAEAGASWSQVWIPPGERHQMESEIAVGPLLIV